MQALSWSLSEAQDRCSAAVVDLDVGVAHGVSAVVIECAGAPAVGVGPLSEASVVVIGVDVGPAASADIDPFDVVTVDPSLAIAGATQNPHAAVTLKQVLRVAPTSIRAGLDLESFAYATLQAGPEFERWLALQGRRVRRQDPSPAVLVEREEQRLTLTLNRPRLRNALSAELRDALVEVLRVATVTEDPITIRGAGTTFSIGGDLAEFGTVADPSTAHQIRSAANAAPWFARLADRLTVELHGPCIGAGVELAAFASHVTATPDTTFSLPEVSMGLIPGAGGTVSVPRRIGRHETLRWALENTRLDASEALGLGLVDQVVE